MIRFVFRLVGFLLFAAAFVALLYDGTKTLAGSQVHVTSVEQTWTNLSPTSLQAAQTRIKSMPEWAVEWLATPALRAPTSLILAIFGVLLMLIGRKRKPLIGYAR